MINRVSQLIGQWNTYRKNEFKFDLIAAIIIFLVAIPLCLGIALASGAPLFAGVLSGIIGGLIVGLVSGSSISVSGPAAGMAAVVLAAIAQLGDFNSFLLALTLAGILQIAIGSLRSADFISDYIPSNVVQGLLCAIGILLIVKQLPLAFTTSGDLSELYSHLVESTQSIAFKPLQNLSAHINPGATIITLISLFLLIYSDRSKKKWIKKFPVPILVVIVGVLLNQVFIFYQSSLVQTHAYLVNLPYQDSFADFLKQFQFPKWNAWDNPQIYVYAFIIAIVASLESILNINAGEKLDKGKRRCSKNRELVAQGVGNFTAGMLGGIPVTSVIIRTSVNIQSGVKTKVATILHGIFILLALLLIATWLNKIPLSALAAILIFTGYKLTKPSIYKVIYQQGRDRFIPFIVTVLGIVFFNLLFGILIGLGISLLYILKRNSLARLDIIKEIYPTGVTNRLVLPQQITFLNKAALIAELNSIPAHSQLIIDARHSDYIDKEVIELLREFKEDQAPLKQISLNLMGFKDHYDIHDYINFINVTTYKVLATLKPVEILNLLKEGNQRFLKNMEIHRNSQIDIKFTADRQNPMAVVLGCIDSRVPVETIFDMSFGDLFCIRVAGNVENPDVLASMEYACSVVGAKLILVLGHTRCGAIQAACDDFKTGHITQLLAKIKPSIESETKIKDNRTGSNQHFVDAVTELNVVNTLKQVYEKSKILREMIDDESIAIVGSIYDVSSGKVHFNNYTKELSKDKNFTQLSEKMHKMMQAK